MVRRRLSSSWFTTPGGRQHRWLSGAFNLDTAGRRLGCGLGPRTSSAPARGCQPASTSIQRVEQVDFTPLLRARDEPGPEDAEGVGSATTSSRIVPPLVSWRCS